MKYSIPVEITISRYLIHKALRHAKNTIKEYDPEDTLNFGGRSLWFETLVEDYINENMAVDIHEEDDLKITKENL